MGDLELAAAKTGGSPREAGGHTRNYSRASGVEPVASELGFAALAGLGSFGHASDRSY